MIGDYIIINRVKTPKGTELMVALVPPNTQTTGIGLIKEQIIGKLMTM